MAYRNSGLSLSSISSFSLLGSLFVSAVIAAPVSAADSDVRFGLGVAPQYGGVGGSVQRVTDYDLLAFGVGVIGYSSWEGTAIGAAISYQRADLIGVREGEPNRHALGFMVGAVGNETSARYTNGQWQDTSNDAIWGGGLTYNYYHRGIRNSGWVVGLALTHGKGSYRDVTGGGITLGYQF